MASLSTGSCKTGVVSKKYILAKFEGVGEAIVADGGEVGGKARDQLVRAFEVMILIEAVEYLAGNCAGGGIANVHGIHSTDLGSQGEIADHLVGVLIVLVRIASGQDG